MRQLRKNTKDAAPAEPDPAHTRGALPSGASRTPRTATGIGSCAALGEVLPPSLRRRQRRLCPPPSGSGSPRSPPRGTRGRSGKGRARPGARRAGTDTPGPAPGGRGCPQGDSAGRRLPAPRDATRHDTTHDTPRHGTPCHPSRSLTDHRIAGGRRGTAAPAPSIPRPAGGSPRTHHDAGAGGRHGARPGRRRLRAARSGGSGR